MLHLTGNLSSSHYSVSLSGCASEGSTYMGFWRMIQFLIFSVGSYFLLLVSSPESQKISIQCFHQTLKLYKPQDNNTNSAYVDGLWLKFQISPADLPKIVKTHGTFFFLLFNCRSQSFQILPFNEMEQPQMEYRILGQAENIYIFIILSDSNFKAT